MIVGEPFSELPPMESAAVSFATVLADAGATLPARANVDLRIVENVRAGMGRVIGKEIDQPPHERWPDYRSLPPPADADHGLPDFWERQFGFDPRDPADAAAIGAGGYATIEHYCNNSDPRPNPKGGCDRGDRRPSPWHRWRAPPTNARWWSRWSPTAQTISWGVRRSRWW